jgi:hypothetical protein
MTGFTPHDLRNLGKPLGDRRPPHDLGALGSAWRRTDRDRALLAACFAVAGLLGVAAGLRPVVLVYDGRPRRAPRLSRL